MERGERGQEDEEDTMRVRVILLRSPWILSILFVCVSFAILWYVLYGSNIAVASSGEWPFLVVFLILLADMNKTPDKERVDSPRIALVAIAWLYLILFFGGDGIFSYVAFDEYIFWILLLLGPFLLLWSVGRLSPSSFGFRRGNMTYALCIIVVAVGHYGFSTLFILSSNSFQIPIEGLTDFLILGSLFPAIIEEMIYRGMIQDRLSKMLNSELSGIAVTTLFFGLSHVWTDAAEFEGDIIAGLLATFYYQFISGLVMAGAYSITRSILAPMVIHYLHNTAGWVHTSQYVSSIPPISVIIQFAGAGACLIIVWLFLRRREATRASDESNQENHQNNAKVPIDLL